MIIMKQILFLSLTGIMIFCNLATTQAEEVVIDLAGNAYVTAKGSTGEESVRITRRGISRWKDPADRISFFFHVAEAQELQLSVKGSGNSTVRISMDKQSKEIKLQSDDLRTIPAGKFKVKNGGYIRIDLQGVKKKGESFGEISALTLTDPKGKISYVHDFSDYWGRRGPSVHMKYSLPKDRNIEWFYNEITVPKEGDVIGSYYMANGFGEGYFGIQNNSPTERRVLFSVWSPFKTDNPKEIPEEQQIKMLRRGENVHTGEFGNEGSGGQSFLRYNWTAGLTYKFLTRIQPDEKGNTVYTAYFFATDENRWRLIASFSRPKTSTWYTHAHSFLENFIPEQGYLSRSAEYSNQWARDTEGKWYEITEAGFTYDATAAAGVRLDYQGGRLENNRFYLKNGGFFNENTIYNSRFTRKAENLPPVIDLEKLDDL